MPGTDFTLATYHLLPELDPDDLLLVEALRARGAAVSRAVWNDPAVDWSAAGTVVVRNTWDYHEHHARFLTWIDTVEARGRLVNPAALMRWGASKTYLADLARAGVAATPTVFVEPAAPRTLSEVARAAGWNDVIVKPAVGLATAGVKRVQLARPDDRDSGELHLRSLLERGTALVQPFLPGVADNGERALIFIAGRFTHAVSKTAFQAMAVAGQAGERAAAATPEQIALGQSALAACPLPPVYARVDMVDEAPGRPLVMELEVVEPSLFLSFGRAAADALAEELMHHWR